jgi:UDP-N-acetylmuramate dehydrogenase
MKALMWIHGNADGFYVLGGGSNVLISDGTLDVPVVLTIGMSGTTARVSGSDIFLDCVCGTYMKDVLSLAVKKGWSGLEFAAGIPGTVGGATASNAGTATGSISSAIEIITTMEEDGSIAEWNGRDLDWAYRYCPLFGVQKRVALSVTLKLRASSPRIVAEGMKRAMEGRKSQPVTSRTAGCVFKNPSGDSAGRLLDASGCKGMSIGDARVSKVHANFIENDGSCTARDIIALALACRKRVEEAFGKSLCFEIKTLGIPEVCANAEV